MLKRIGILIVQICFVVAVTTLAWFDVSSAIIAICAVILVVIAGRLSSLVEFSFGPLKAKIERNLSESEELLKGLKALAVVQARAVNSASVSTGRWASGDDWIFQSVKRIEQSLRKIGVSDDDLREARQDFVKLTVGDAAAAAMGGPRVPMHRGKIAVAEWQDVMKTSRFDPDAIEEYLGKWEELNADREVRISDMRWMLEHGDVRDRDQYMRAHNEVPWPSS